MSKKESTASIPVSKHTRSKPSGEKAGRFNKSYTRDKEVNSVVNTHLAPKRPNSKDSNSS